MLKSWDSGRVGAQFELIAARTVIAISALVLVGWVFDLRILKSGLTGYITMKANTAICLALLASVLLILKSETTDRWRLWTAYGLCGIVMLISAGTLIEYLFRVDLRIDEALFPDPGGVSNKFPAGRLAPVTAVSFIFLSTAFCIGNLGRNSLYRCSQFLFVLTFLIGLQGLVGYVVGLTYLFGSAFYTQLAFHTALSLVLLGAGALTSRSDRGFIEALNSSASGAVMAKRMLCGVVAVPVIVRWISIQGQQHSLYDQDFSVLIQVMGNIILMAIVVISAATAMFEAEKFQLILLEREREARHAAEIANSAKSNFLANMSHEIRTPLGAVIGFSDMLIGSSRTEAEQTEFASAIKRNGDQLLLLIDDLLDISKIEAGRFDVERNRASLDQVCEDLNTLMRYRANAKNTKFHLEKSGPLPNVIHTDLRRLRQILINIVGNAIKFTPEGGEVLVTVELRQTTKPVLIFKVVDSGIGISPADSDLLFQPFSQVDVTATRNYGGTGLGLALSRRLARALGGDVTLEESAPGKGSTFVIEIYPGEIAEETLEERTMPIGVSKKVEPSAVTEEFDSTHLNGVRVLLVDDSPDNRFLIARLLRGKGAEVETAEDGIEGVEKAMHGKFDIVLMDIQMPRMDGFEAIRRLRSLGYSPPIVALTAHAMKEDRQRCLEVGFADHLTKPVNKHILFETVRRAGSSPISENSSIET